VVSQGPLADSVLYLPRPGSSRLYLDTFRGEPAISEFDWHFTSTHSSSPNFATLVGTGLHVLLQTLHPGHK
jgi:hypothetical protein